MRNLRRSSTLSLGGWVREVARAAQELIEYGEMTDSLELLVPAMVSATVTFAVALLFRTPRQLALYALFGLGTLFILAISRPNVDPAAIIHLIAVVLFVIPAAGGLVLGGAVKAIYVLRRNRTRAKKGHA